MLNNPTWEQSGKERAWCSKRKASDGTMSGLILEPCLRRVGDLDRIVIRQASSSSIQFEVDAKLLLSDLKSDRRHFTFRRHTGAKCFEAMESRVLGSGETGRQSRWGVFS